MNKLETEIRDAWINEGPEGAAKVAIQWMERFSDSIGVSNPELAKALLQQWLENNLYYTTKESSAKVPSDTPQGSIETKENLGIIASHGLTSPPAETK